jgi:hypothetical protein
MADLIVAASGELVRVRHQSGSWHAPKPPSGRGMQCLAADPRRPDVLYAGSRGEAYLAVVVLLLLAGPGWFSLDALLFGKRVGGEVS